VTIPGTALPGLYTLRHLPHPLLIPLGPTWVFLTCHHGATTCRLPPGAATCLPATACREPAATCRCLAPICCHAVAACLPLHHTAGLCLPGRSQGLPPPLLDLLVRHLHYTTTRSACLTVLLPALPAFTTYAATLLGYTAFSCLLQCCFLVLRTCRLLPACCTGSQIRYLNTWVSFAWVSTALLPACRHTLPLTAPAPVCCHVFYRLGCLLHILLHSLPTSTCYHATPCCLPSPAI